MCGPAFAHVPSKIGDRLQIAWSRAAKRRLFCHAIWSPSPIFVPPRRQATQGLVAVKIEIVTPTLSRAGSGNTVTARRYARILASLGHRAKLVNRYHDGRCDLLIALHAARSSRSVLQFRRLYPESPTIVVLTGTDLYRDIKTDPRARRSLELATRLIGL